MTEKRSEVLNVAVKTKDADGRVRSSKILGLIIYDDRTVQVCAPMANDWRVILGLVGLARRLEGRLSEYYLEKGETLNTRIVLEEMKLVVRSVMALSLFSLYRLPDDGTAELVFGLADWPNLF